MDYKRTRSIEFQAPHYLAICDLDRRISDAIQVVLEHAAMIDGLEREGYMGDSEATKGWASEATSENKAISRRSESERIDQLIEDFHDKYDDEDSDDEAMKEEAARRRKFYLREETWVRGR